jgi:hypothetical protein
VVEGEDAEDPVAIGVDPPGENGIGIGEEVFVGERNPFGATCRPRGQEKVRHRPLSQGKGPFEKGAGIGRGRGFGEKPGRERDECGAVQRRNDLGGGEDPPDTKEIRHLPKRVRGKEMVHQDRKAAGEHEGQLPHHELRSRGAGDEHRTGRTAVLDLPGENESPAGPSPRR